VATMALALAGCTDDDPPEAAPTTTTEPFACAGSSADPVPLDGVAAGGTVVDVVARPTGQLVAVGTSVWIRDPGETEWRSTAKPGGPDDQVTAAAERDDAVWVVTNYFADTEGQSRLFRSSDLETWTEVPFVVEGAPTAWSVQGLVLDGDRWLGLAQADDQFHLLASPDGEAWTTEASLPLRSDPETARALFDLALLDTGPTSVGFSLGGPALRPLEVGWATDGAPTDRSPEDADLAGVRLWAMAALTDGRAVVAADLVELAPDDTPTGFTPLLYERSEAGALDRLGELPAPSPFAAPADLVEVDDGQVVVVGGIGDSRDTLSPGAWTVCLP
jgi:hypothetical protein